jgi:hypothetical protein
MARVGEEFPLDCPRCAGDIRLIAYITERERLGPPLVSPARGPPTDWNEIVQVHDYGGVFQASPEELLVIDIHSL